MTLDAYMYGDPEKVAIRRQEEALRKDRECGSCVHKQTTEFRGEVAHYCEFKRHVYGKRCELYRANKDGQ